MGKIPDRWGAYQAIGQPIKGTRFITFKVPLKNYIFQNQTTFERFTTQNVMQDIPDLKLVIDLTNTTSYYFSQDFIKNGIEYKKLFCKGHVIPADDIISEFNTTVDKFLKKHPKGLIGVHCTHGLNRTGYLVCRYMIEKMGFSYEEAKKNFEEARGHQMERKNYLDHLELLSSKRSQQQL